MPATTTTPTVTQEIFVKQQCGAYVTSTVKGKRASATMGPRAAAELLASKLFGTRVQSVAEVGEGNVYVTKWLITATEGAAP